jgi:hypothetical protein
MTGRMVSLAEPLAGLRGKRARTGLAAAVCFPVAGCSRGVGPVAPDHDLGDASLVHLHDPEFEAAG